MFLSFPKRPKKLKYCQSRNAHIANGKIYMYSVLFKFDFNAVLLFCHNFNAFLCVQMVSYFN